MAEKNHVEEFLENIHPEHGKLQVDEKGGLHTIIVDAETDGFICKFVYDGCVQIKTKMAYISLDSGTLHQIAILLEEAEEIYDKRTQAEWDSFVE